MLTKENARENYVLSTERNSVVSKECGELFRGFKVGLISAISMNNRKKSKFYQIQTAFHKESYYFEIPDNRCIELWLGSPNELSTTVKSFKREELSPVQVQVGKGPQIVGVDSETYSSPWPEKQSMEYFSDHPAPLTMLYVDFKSKEFVPQMMYTIAPKKKCHLFAYVMSNDVGSCKSSYKQRSNAIRPFGNRTSYTLRFESGVDTNDTKGTKSAQTEILDTEFEEGTEQIVEDIFRDEGLQSYNEYFGPTSEKILENTNTTIVDEKDVTPFGKSLGAAVGNMVSAAACMGLTALTSGYVGCKNKIGFQDVEQTTFHEAYTKKELSNNKITQSSSFQHSMQNTLQVAFTNSKGVSTEASHSDMDSLSQMVSKRTIFQYSIHIPDDKSMIPMQMAVDCDGKDVKIPWIKFRLINESVDGDNRDEEYSPEQEEKKSEDENESDDYSIVIEISKQQKAAEAAYNQKYRSIFPIDHDENDIDYSKYTGLEIEGKDEYAEQPYPIVGGNDEDNVDYEKYTGKKVIPGLKILKMIFMYLGY